MKNIKQQEETVSMIKKLNNTTKINISEISQALGFTRQTFRNKLNKLKEENIISNFTININSNINPNLKHIFLEIKTNPKEPELVDKLLKIPQLKMLDGIFGEFSLIAFFIFKNAEEFNQILRIIDNIMSNSYFKKYQIIETIKVYKINGIKLSDVNLIPKMDLDEKDYLILKILQEKQGLKPISTYEIKDILKKQYKQETSQATIHNKIKSFVKSRLILNYTVDFSPRKIGFKGKYIVRIKPKDPSKYDEIALKLEKNKYISDLFRIGEQYGIFTIVRVKEIEDYGNFIKNLYDTEEIEDTFTNFVLDELKVFTNFSIY